jgi:hypothetical protein
LNLQGARNAKGRREKEERGEIPFSCLLPLFFPWRSWRLGGSISPGPAPLINQARDEGPASRERFDRLHRDSVRLNAVVLLIGVGLIVGFALKKGPTTGGIEEPPPEISGRP